MREQITTMQILDKYITKTENAWIQDPPQSHENSTMQLLRKVIHQNIGNPRSQYSTSKSKTKRSTKTR